MDAFFTEPALLALGDDRLLCVLRTFKGDFHGHKGGYTNLHQCESSDGGSHEKSENR